MGKTVTNKYVNLVEEKIQQEIFSGIKNPGKDLTPLLYYGQPKHQINQVILNEIHDILS